VTFPLFEKVHARGPEKSPLYKTLTEQTPDGIRGEVKWNFTKFLADVDGHVVARFDTAILPDAAVVRAAIEAVVPGTR